MVAQKSSVKTIHLISHNHWDREWIFTARYTNRWLPPFFENVFTMLEEQPDYRFVLDGQTAIIEDCLSQLSADEVIRFEKQIARFAQSGQLQIGPAYLQPDWGLVSGEALVRNLMIGHKISERYGKPMKAGWMLDNFGQIAQAPQIYRGFDIDGVFVWRGVDMGTDDIKSEFLWQSPDGSDVLAVYLINSYRNAMVLSLTKEIALDRIRAEAQALLPFATSPNVLLMNGYEQVPWPDDVLPIIADFNRTEGNGYHCVQSTPTEYINAVRETSNGMPKIQGYFYSGRYMPVLKGVFSSRSGLKLLNNECQRELERWAEPFATIAWTLGTDYPKDKLEKAWKTLLLNHAHDDMCGCCIDNIARDMEDRFHQVLQVASDITEQSLKAISNAIHNCKDESLTAFIVFNPSTRSRSEVIGLSLSLPEGTEGFSIRDARDKVVPYQVVNRDGNNVDLFLFVSDVPSVGYKSYYIFAGEEQGNQTPHVEASAEQHLMENAYLRVTINEDGSFNVKDKQTGQSHERLGYYEDGGDAGDTYDYSWPEQDQIITSLGTKANITLLEAGPLMARFKVELKLNLPESLAPDRKTRSSKVRELPIVNYVELSAESHRVEVKSHLLNVVKDHRLRVMFPSGINSDHCYAEEPYDIARMPVRDETSERQVSEQVKKLMLAGRYTVPVNTHPFQNFIDYSDGERGLAVISRRGTEFEILPENGTMALTLLRGVGWLTRYDLQTRIGDVGPHIFTPEAQCLGEHEFHFAVYPHSHEWPEDKAHIEAFSHNLRLRAVQSHDPGQLPDELSFLSLGTRDAINAFRLTALKRAESGDGIIIRFFNTLEKDATGELKAWWDHAQQVVLTNLNEELIEQFSSLNGSIKVAARQKEIVTLKLKVRPQQMMDAARALNTRLLPALRLKEIKTQTSMPPLLTQEEVQAESSRVRKLEDALLNARAAVYTLEDEIERRGRNEITQLYELQQKKMEVAALTRQRNEARISELLNRQLFVRQSIEDELEEIGEAMSWSRTKKRAGEYLLHYYEGRLRKQSEHEH